MEKWGEKCLRTNFGTLGDSVNDPEFQDVCDLIVGKAMEGYVRSEYGNLWETHQCRPHAYGHTWSPGYELPAGMLHGQAVGTCMGFGAYLSYKVGFINETEMTRILRVISDCELSLYHPIMDNSAAVWKSQVAMIEKRGGNLCAPIPRPLGESGYLNEISEEDLHLRMKEYKAICQSYPRNGRGVAEIIKMAVMKDITLFELMEKWGEKCLRTNFGTLGDSVHDPEFQDVCNLIVGKAMEGYVRSEYGNLWETHQCRPHAYGHTWSPGYELPAGMLHGQAVGTCMGFGAYLSYKVGFINETEMTRILRVISDCELSLYHPIMDNSAAVWKSQVAMIEKRGGNLCAPIPRPLGESGYLNEISEEDLDLRMKEYKAICQSYPRNGRGVEEHCVDVGLEDPQAKKIAKAALQQDRVVVTPTDLVVDKLAKAAASTEDRGTNGQGTQALNEGLRPMTVSSR